MQTLSRQFFEPLLHLEYSTGYRQAGYIPAYIRLNNKAFKVSSRKTISKKENTNRLTIWRKNRLNTKWIRNSVIQAVRKEAKRIWYQIVWLLLIMEITFLFQYVNPYILFPWFSPPWMNVDHIFIAYLKFSSHRIVNFLYFHSSSILLSMLSLL